MRNAKLGQVMKRSKLAAWIMGLAFIVGPWLWALIAVSRDSKQGDAQGALTLATYCTPILLPLGLIIIAFSFRKGS